MKTHHERPASSASAEPPAAFHVVGIGASAGGLEALEAFFDHIPSVTDMAFVVVQHLSPDFKSVMDEILARHTDLPIHPVEDGMVVEGGHIYLIPPRKEMIISRGRLLLSERDRQQELTLPIDVFFRSLAQDCGPRAVAIVLSGGGSDGSRGIKAVQEAGGLVIVQDVGSAQFDGMPKTAREAGVAHWVLSPDEMPRVLAQHVGRPHTVSMVPAPPAAGLPAVYGMLETEFGIDFTHYKPSTVTRRIERRLALARATDMDDYVERLRNGREELDVLYRDLLIGVTRFFRNEEAFRRMEERILPELFQRLPQDLPLRVWVAACATGEEAYSLAILLHEIAQRHGGRQVKIFATDVHKGSLETASRALYGEEAVANVTPERRDRYFSRHGESWQVNPEIRQMVVFAPHDVIRDAPFTRVDLISCRNMLIYLQNAAQQKVLGLFHFALNRGGVLLLGPSESPGTLVHDFETIDRHWRIYRKFTDVRIPVDARFQTPRSMEGRLGQPVVLPPMVRLSGAHLIGTYDALLDQHMPPSLLVSDRGELVHTFGGASRFLSHRDGRPGMEVLDVVDEELKLVLVGGLRRALTQPGGVVFKGVRARQGEGGLHDITIKRVGGRGRGATHLLVSFDDAQSAASASTEEIREIPLDQVTRERLAAMQAELDFTKENLQSAIEALETSNEELQAANEELLSSNEELQSTNEELQSVNEELYTVNAEYQRKIGELTELTNDMDNLLSSTDIGTIFLDDALHIRKFTPQIAVAFNLLPRDLGRPIETFSHNLEHPTLVADLRGVLESGAPIERETKDRLGRSLFLRILPYRTSGASAGVVLTLIDVSVLKTAEDALFHERYLLNSLLATVPDAIYFKDASGRFIRVNPVMASRLGLDDPRDAAGTTYAEMPHKQLALELHRADERVVDSGRPQLDELERRSDAEGNERWDQTTRLPLCAREEVVGVIAIIRDVTARQRAEARIQEEVRRRDQFLAMLSHELRNPLGAIVTATSLLDADGGSSDQRARLLGLLDRQSRQMARLLDDLLEASRVTQSKIELRRSAVALATIVRDCADAVRVGVAEKGVAFEVECDDGPIWVDGDQARLQQIVANLLSNAAKYTPKGGHVLLQMKREGDEAVIRVRDDGVGLAPEMLESAFDLFVQARRTLERADGGLGVGLTLVRALVHLHGGVVTAASEGEGKGSEFEVRLPVGDPPAPSTPSRVSAPTRKRGTRVVIIEDNTDAAEMVCEVLSHAGYRCDSASDGLSGVELVRRVRPAIAVVDVGLPGIDGFEVARRLRADPETGRTLLVAMTGYGQTDDRNAAFAAGFDEHMVKPVHPDRLLALLGTTEPA